MDVIICDTRQEAGSAAAEAGTACLRVALQERGAASVVLATGASQFDLLDALVRSPGLAWPHVTAFHLDEYLGVTADHPASFRRYLKERFLDRLPEPVEAFHAIHGEADPEAECARLNALLAPVAIDVAFVGIGENGHLAFNDPPADFDATDPYLAVRLDDACRRQQLGEGWFARLEDVPERAISMSVRQIMRARTLICTVPEARKAAAVRQALEGPLTAAVPASILQRHPDCRMFLDRDSAALLTRPYA